MVTGRFASKRQLMRRAHLRLGIVGMQFVQEQGKSRRPLPGPVAPWRACIQFMLPRSVLISPLWHINRLGWARSQDGKVLVENRECTIAKCET